MPSKIPTTVITGFLGAGKTTLIRNLLSQAEGRRIALIINEFGDIGVDGDVLRGCGDATCSEDDIVELANGCICCTVAEDFVPTLETLLGRESPSDHIVIETSGLALPQPLVRAFGWPDIRTRVTVDAVVTVVDGPALADDRIAHDEAALMAQRAADDSLDHETPVGELFADQLACADMIVVSKADTLDAATVEAVRADIGARARPGVRVVPSGADGLSAGILLGLGMASEDDMAARRELHHHHHHHDDHDDHDDHHHDHGHDAFESFSVTVGEIVDPAAFETALRTVIADHGILRAKGFLAVTGKPMRRVVQAVGPRIDGYFDRPFGSEPRQSRLVIIGTAGLDRGAITAALGG